MLDITILLLVSLDTYSYSRYVCIVHTCGIEYIVGLCPSSGAQLKERGGYNDLLHMEDGMKAQYKRNRNYCELWIIQNYSS